MGRSVSTLSGATAIAYFHFEPDVEYYKEYFEDVFEADDEDDRPDFDTWMWEQYNDTFSDFEWEDFKDWVTETAKLYWPSFTDCDEWVDRENHVILSNAHSIITISEYCGIASVCLGANFDRENFYADAGSMFNLGERFRKQIAERFENTFSNVTKLGTFSNGEAVFQKVCRRA